MWNRTVSSPCGREKLQRVLGPCSAFLVILLAFGCVPAVAGDDPAVACDEETTGLLPCPETVRQARQMMERYADRRPDAPGEGETLSDSAAPDVGTGGAPVTWTYLFYDDAEFEGYDPLLDFAADARSDVNLDVVVLQDNMDGPAFVWYVDENHQAVELESWGEVDMGDYATLNDFIEYGKANYPADRYLLAMYDHGGGWSGACVDVTDSGWLTMDDIDRAIGDAGGVDILAFTAPCLMGAIESVYQVRDSVDVYIGSSELSGYIHWRGVIGDVCALLNDSSHLTTAEVSAQIVELVDANSPPGFHEMLTLSAVDTAGTAPAVSALDTLAGHLLERLELVADSIAVARGLTLEYGLDASDRYQVIDLYLFLELYAALETDPVILDDLQALMAALDQAILAEEHGVDEEGAHGLSIFFPQWRDEYISTYATHILDLVEDTAWNDFLIAYLELVSPGLPTLVTGPGPGPGNPALVRTFSPWGTAEPLCEWTAYGVSAWGVNVACGDLDGDLKESIITGAGPGAVFGPHVRGFDRDGQPLPGLSFLAYGTNKYGVNVVCGDLNGDGIDEIVTGAGPGAVFGPHVRGWGVDGGAASPMAGVSYMAYGTHKWGVNVACGDIDGDGKDEIITGAGPGAVFGPHVRGWNVDDGYASPMPGVSYMAYGTHQWGVNVACGDINGDGIDEIVTGPGPGALFGAHVRGWDYNGDVLAAIPRVNFFAYPVADCRYGVVVSMLDLHGDGEAEILTATGSDPDQPAWVRAWRVRYDGVILIGSCDFLPYDDLGADHGGKVAGGLI